MTYSGRFDGIEKHYRPAEIVGGLSKFFFWLSAALSLLTLYPKSGVLSASLDIVVPTYVVSVVIYTLISLYSQNILLPGAEEHRRKQLISDSIGVPLTSEVTTGYYNNNLEPSIRRLGVAIFENTLFSKAVCGRMAVQSRIVILTYLSTWLFLALYRPSDTNFIIYVTQLVFAGEILSSHVRLEIILFRHRQLFAHLYNLFLGARNLPDALLTAQLLEAFASYEATKAAAGIRQSSKIFHSINASVSAEWDRIKETIGLDGGANSNNNHEMALVSEDETRQ